MAVRMNKKEVMQKVGQWNKKTAWILTNLGGFCVERAMGIEPTSSAWKADILADVRCPHILFYRDASSIIA